MGHNNLSLNHWSQNVEKKLSTGVFLNLNEFHRFSIRSFRCFASIRTICCIVPKRVKMSKKEIGVQEGYLNMIFFMKLLV